MALYWNDTEVTAVGWQTDPDSSHQHILVVKNYDNCVYLAPIGNYRLRADGGLQEIEAAYIAVAGGSPYMYKLRKPEYTGPRF